MILLDPGRPAPATRFDRISAPRKPGKPHSAMPPEIGRLRFDAVKAFWLWGMALPGLFMVSLGAVSHACLACSLLGGPALDLRLTGLGGPLTWARIHAVRDYWQNRLDCPPYFAYRHSPLRDFWWNLHLSFVPADPRADAKLHPDVLRDPWLRFLEATWPLHTAALAGILYVTLGSEAVAVCVCGRVAGGILGHWAVGYASHAWGRRSHAIPGAAETGTNNWALGVMSFGEGFHNTHHAFPDSPRMGRGRLELDLGWLSLKLMRRLGWVRFRD